MRITLSATVLATLVLGGCDRTIAAPEPVQRDVAPAAMNVSDAERAALGAALEDAQRRLLGTSTQGAGSLGRALQRTADGLATLNSFELSAGLSRIDMALTSAAGEGSELSAADRSALELILMRLR